MADFDRLVDEGVGLRCLLCYKADGALEDVTLSPGHSAMLALATVRRRSSTLSKLLLDDG